MSRRSCSVLSTLAVAALMSSAVAVAPVFAQVQPVIVSPVQQAAIAFKANPGLLLEQFPKGGAELVSRVRDIAVADPATLQPLLNLLPKANKDQKSAIGAALAQAARIVVRSNQAYANEIQLSIANTKDQDVVLAYTASAGDQPIGAVGGGGSGASGGASGGQTNALPGGPSSTGAPQAIGNAGVATSPFGYSSSVSGLSGIATSVSP